MPGVGPCNGDSMTDGHDGLESLMEVLRKASSDPSNVNKFCTLQSLTFLDLPTLEQEGIGEGVDRPMLMAEVQKYLIVSGFVIHDKYKIINDPVHGSLSLHPVAMIIVDSPPFQRLRHIRQLGALDYVYPSALYSRFEHSLGVYHLAGELVNLLKKKQPELKVTAIDAMCVQLAGLCHDLGHGPFSHLFDGRVIPTLLPDTKWTHETASMLMIDHLFKLPNVRQGFNDWGFDDKDINFIKSLIGCSPDEEATGRGVSKRFLYDIVANGRNGMDVDKWDFFARDCLHLGIKNSFEHERMIHHLRVIYVDGRPEICVRDKEEDTVYNMFYTRYDLHRKAYQHVVARAIELMITEAIVKAAPYLKFGGKTISDDLLNDMDAYSKLDDGIFYLILHSQDEKMKESRELLERINHRELWKCVGQSRQPLGVTNDVDMVKLREELSEAAACDIRVDWSNKHFGKKKENPLDYMRFYEKKTPNVAKQLTDSQKSLILPKHFQDRLILAYNTDRTVDSSVYTAVDEVFTRWGLNSCTHI